MSGPTIRPAVWWLGPLFWTAAAVFAILGLRLAAVNENVGGWDAAANLVAARSIAEGRGFTTDMVQDLVAPHELPGPETVRAPGAIYLIGAIFTLTGAGLAVPVIVNTILILLSAIVMRHTTSRLARPWVGDAVGLLMLLGNANFAVLPFLNNNPLVLLTALALMMAVVTWQASLSNWWIAGAAGVLTGCAFLTKQTYVLSFVPFTIVLIGTMHGLSRVQRFGRLVVAGLVTLIISAPYFAMNLAQSGSLIHSPIQDLRLPVRYGLIPVDGFQRRVLLDAPRPTYASVVGEIGLHGLLSRELEMLRQVGPTLAGRGIAVILWALGGLLLLQAAKWPLYAMAGSLAIAGLFDSIWWVPEPRYLYPLYPILLFLGALGVASFIESSPDDVGLFMRRRLCRAFTVVMAVAIGAALLSAQGGWRAHFATARIGEPEWTGAVRQLPDDAIVLTSATPYVPWWTRRRSVIEPWGTRADLERVMALYAPTAFLDIAPGPRPDRAPFEPGELRSLARGDGWELHAIRGKANGE